MNESDIAVPGYRMIATVLESLSLMTIVVFASSLALSTSLLVVIRKLPVNRFFQDPPGKRKIHQRIIPRTGGLCLVISFLALVYAVRTLFGTQLPDSEPFWNALVFATAAILIVGILDDTYLLQIENRAKFILEILIAVEVVFLMGVRFQEVNVFGMSRDLGWMGPLLTVVWLVGVTNAFNIVDGVDGLAGSLVLAGVVALGLLGYRAQSRDVVLVCSVVGGITAGFLMHNLPPAKVFLGDTGSLFLGMAMGILSVQIASVPVSQSHYPLLSAFLVAGFPVLDVFAAMARRYARAVASGANWREAVASTMVPDSDHIHHRLTHRGLDHGETTLFLLLFGSVFCAGAVIVARAPAPLAWAVLAYLAFVALWLLSRLSFLDKLHDAIAAQYAKNALSRRYPIGVVQADDVLHHALANFAQNEFDFLFLSREQIATSVFEHAAIIAVNTVTDQHTDDLDFAVRMARLHRCPVVLISDHVGQAPVLHAADSGLLLHAKRPVYIPALLEEVLKAIQSQGPEPPAGHRLINVALQPMANWNHAAKIPKR